MNQQPFNEVKRNVVDFPAPPSMTSVEKMASGMLERMKQERDEARAEVARLEAIIDSIIRVIDGYEPVPPKHGWKQ